VARLIVAWNKEKSKYSITNVRNVDAAEVMVVVSSVAVHEANNARDIYYAWHGGAETHQVRLLVSPPISHATFGVEHDTIDNASARAIV